MLLALFVTCLLLPKTKPVERNSSLADPFRALRYPALLLMGVVALLYNFGFFTLLAYAPFPLDLSAHMIGLIFFGWGLLLAIGATVVAPRLQRIFGTVNTLLAMLFSLAVILAVMAIFTDSKGVLSACIVVSGFALGITNTLVTETVMSAAPVQRGVASAAYSFVRFSGAAVAPWLAGKLGETISPHVPFWVGAAAVLLGVILLALKRALLAHIDGNIEHPQKQPTAPLQQSRQTPVTAARPPVS